MITMDQAQIVLFPIRHHSPACAWHLGQLIAARRPRAILIEGPHDATPLVEHLAHPALRAPVAIYTRPGHKWSGGLEEGFEADIEVHLFSDTVKCSVLPHQKRALAHFR